MTRILALLTLTLTISCTTHKSKISNHKLEAAPHEVPVQQAGCGWVTVDESLSAKFLMLKLGGTTRQYNKSLYYCCPGHRNPEPICYQTQWVSK